MEGVKELFACDLSDSDVAMLSDEEKECMAAPVNVSPPHIALSRELTTDILPATSSASYNSTAPPTSRSISCSSVKTVVSVPTNTATVTESNNTTTPSPVVATTASTPVSRSPCVVCKKKHALYYCRVFKNLNHAERLRVVVSSRRCSNCLGDTHRTNQCPISTRCAICKGRHHSLLHSASGSGAVKRHSNKSGSPYQERVSSEPKPSSVSRNTVATTGFMSLGIQYVTSLAPSAIVQLWYNEHSYPVRALLDPCGRVSQICTSLVDWLRIPTSTVDRDRFCRVVLRSSYNSNRRLTVTVRVANLRHVRSPVDSIADSYTENFEGFQLADPEFNRSRGVAIVLGPDVYPQIIRGQIHATPGLPLAQLTIFGWVISGSCSM